MLACLRCMFFLRSGNQRFNMPPQLLAFLTHGATKTFGVILLVGALIGGAWLWHRNGYNIGYREGYAKASEVPKNTYNGPTTVIQKTDCPAPSVFGIDLGKIALGLVFKK